MFHSKNYQEINLETKIITNKVSLLNLVKELGNIFKAYKILGYNQIASTLIKNNMILVEIGFT